MKKLNLENRILYIIMSIFIYLSLSNYLKLNNFNILSICLLVPIYMIISKYYFRLVDKKSRIIGLIFAIFYSIGNICYINTYTKINVFNEIFTFKTLYCTIGLYILFSLLISIILNKLFSLNTESESNFKSNKKLFVGSMLIILLCNIPYFFSCFPGLIAPDSVYQIEQFKHIQVLTDHHPVMHTLFIKFCYKVASFFTESENIKAAFTTLVQMIIMSGIYSYFIVFLNKHKVNKKILIIMSIIFGLLPVYAFFSLSMWKDVLFGGFFLLFMINIYTLIERQDNLRIYHYISFVIISLLVLFFRNNALYMYIIFVPFIIIYLKKHFKYIAPSVLIVFIVFFTIKYSVYNHLGVERSKSWEYLGIPIQQVGRMAYKNVKFTKEEKTEIEKFITIENLKKDYNPRVSDGIKFSLNLNQEYFETNNKEFLKLWSHLVVKHFDVAVETYFVSTLGYWYPNLENNAVEIGVTKNNIDLYSNPLVPEKINKFINNLYSYNTPFLSLQWNLGLFIWFTVLLGITCFKKNKKYFICYIPVIGMWLTLMLASPVNGMLRYIFWLYTSFPFLLFISTFQKNKK